MITLILWCILFVLCWPLALLAPVLYPVVWLVLLPFLLLGIAVGGALALVGDCNAAVPRGAPPCLTAGDLLSSKRF
jgi:hypothetical protein